MKVKQIQDRQLLLEICRKYGFNLILEELQTKYDIYDPEQGSLKPFYYVFVEDVIPCGIITVNSVASHYKNYLQILYFDVNPDFKGKNIPAKMFQWLEDKAKTQGWKGLSIQTIHPVNKKWLEKDEYTEMPKDLKIDDIKSAGDRAVEEYIECGFKPVSYTTWDGLNLKKTFDMPQSQTFMSFKDSVLKEAFQIYDFNSWDDTEQTFKEDIEKNLEAFIYKYPKGDPRSNWIYVRIFNQEWPLYDDFKDKIYIKGKNVTLKDGWFYTLKSTNAVYKDIIIYEGSDIPVIIKDINSGINTCENMFAQCYWLKKVPLFDTSNVINFSGMFWGCKSLESVAKLNTDGMDPDAVEYWPMIEMFGDCNYDLFDDETLNYWCPDEDGTPDW